MVFGNKSATIPTGLTTDAFLIRPLSVTDVELDFAAVMESKTFLRKWDLSSWPPDDFTLEGNYKDLDRHEQEHIRRESFTFTIMNRSETECLGCLYIFPKEVRWLTRGEFIQVGASDWADVEALIFFWIRQSRLAEGLDRRLLEVIRPWMAQAWTFDGCMYVTTEPFEQQVAMFEEAGLVRQVEIKHPTLSSKYLAYT